MLDQGRVFKIEKGLAWVEFASSAACAQCGACSRASSGRMVTEADNAIGAKVGDTVAVEISPVVLTLFPLVAYGFPVIMFFIGMAAGSFFSETAAIIAGLIFLVAGLLLTKLIDKYITRQKRFRSNIKRVV
jgi:sigma-E factor negative regulatory protein RseC